MAIAGGEPQAWSPEVNVKRNPETGGAWHTGRANVCGLVSPFREEYFLPRRLPRLFWHRGIRLEEIVDAETLVRVGHEDFDQYHFLEQGF